MAAKTGKGKATEGDLPTPTRKAIVTRMKRTDQVRVPAPQEAGNAETSST